MRLKEFSVHFPGSIRKALSNESAWENKGCQQAMILANSCFSAWASNNQNLLPKELISYFEKLQTAFNTSMKVVWVLSKYELDENDDAWSVWLLFYQNMESQREQHKMNVVFTQDGKVKFHGIDLDLPPPQPTL